MCKQNNELKDKWNAPKFLMRIRPWNQNRYTPDCKFENTDDCSFNKQKK